MRIAVCRDHTVSELDSVLAGTAVQGYCSYRESRAWAQRAGVEDVADVWYTERNGDPITMFVPKGTPYEQLPDMAMDYIVFGWERPEDRCCPVCGFVKPHLTAGAEVCRCQ